MFPAGSDLGDHPPQTGEGTLPGPQDPETSLRTTFQSRRILTMSSEPLQPKLGLWHPPSVAEFDSQFTRSCDSFLDLHDFTIRKVKRFNWELRHPRGQCAHGPRSPRKYPMSLVVFVTACEGRSAWAHLRCEGGNQDTIDLMLEPLLVSERFDRIEMSGLSGWIVAKEDAYGRGEQEATKDGRD